MSGLDSREKILRAAIDVFAEKGKYGAKMEEIAARADLNKAMIYYSREHLHQQALGTVISRNLSILFGHIDELLRIETEPIETLQRIIAAYFDLFSSEKTFVKLLLDALASPPQELEMILSHFKSTLNLDLPGKFLTFLEQGMERRIFRKIDPKQLLLNIVAMSLFYFLGKPAIKVFLDLHIEDEQAFLKERQKAILDLIIVSIVETDRTSVSC